MAATQLGKVVRHLRIVLARQETAGLTEADLWERYVGKRDEAAFETLVRRHGPMVLGVCRRILRNEQDAEDAFQATFLVLVRRAASLQSPSTIASWLYGVARRTALEAKRAIARRRAKEAMAHPRMGVPEDPCADLWPALDQELGRLAEKYRAVVVLCDLEGKTRKEVARHLGWVEGTVASRLARGRSLLAKRLACRGFTGTLVAAALAEGAALACMPAERAVATITAICLSGADGAAANAFLSAKVITLTEGVLKSMFLTKVKNGLALVLIVGLVTLGAGGLVSRSQGIDPAGEMPGTQEQGRADVHERVLDLKQQLQQMQKKIARLEEETQPKHDERDPSVSNLFKYRVPFEIGTTQNNRGGRIEIREVWGTRPRIEVGGQYLVRGKYVLPSGERGKLYFYATADGDWGRARLATLDLQSVAVNEREGEFTLVHGMAGPGYFHLILTESEHYSQWFANVYFGTGDNVWRKKL